MYKRQKAFAEELYHAAGSLGFDLEVISCERDEDVQDQDIVLISAGEPRLPGVQMSRRDLAVKNARIIKDIATAVAPQNPHAKYVVITNPVDSMAMVFKKYSSAKFVISTGTNLESLRFRSKLARTLKAPVSQVHGWVGGEHGTAAAILWSTVKINNLSIEDYTVSRGITFSGDALESYVKDVSKFIVDSIGGTEYGPAASFLEIVRAIAKDTKETLAVATPMKFDEIPKPVHVSVPLALGASIGPTLFEALTEEERSRIKNAAQAIYSNYRTTSENM